MDPRRHHKAYVYDYARAKRDLEDAVCNSLPATETTPSSAIMTGQGHLFAGVMTLGSSAWDPSQQASDLKVAQEYFEYFNNNYPGRRHVNRAKYAQIDAVLGATSLDAARDAIFFPEGGLKDPYDNDTGVIDHLVNPDFWLTMYDFAPESARMMALKTGLSTSVVRVKGEEDACVLSTCAILLRCVMEIRGQNPTPGNAGRLDKFVAFIYETNK